LTKKRHLGNIQIFTNARRIVLVLEKITIKGDVENRARMEEALPRKMERGWGDSQRELLLKRQNCTVKSSR